jgi:predicted nucleic acid-binding protein
MSGKYVLDSTVPIDIANGKEGTEALRDALNDAERYISIISCIEALSSPKISAEEERYINSFITDCIIVPLNNDIARNTIKLRRASKLKLPDAIIAATALTLGADLISRDEHLLSLNWPGLRVVQIL